MNILKNEFLKLRQKKHPFSYKEEDFTGSFIAATPKKAEAELLPIGKVIYVFWTGENPMTENREKAFRALQEKTEVPVQLITPQNLHEYILDEHPLHGAFNHLSLVHKADYLRCYFMHFHGGGYSDIKQPTHSWEEPFRIVENSDKWIMGYPEKKYRAAARPGGKLQKTLEQNFLSLIGNCAYISRPQTPFTQEWYNELLKRMDTFAPQLEKFPGNTFGDNEGYPIPWTAILGNIFHPLCLKYHDKLYRCELLRPVAGKHR